MSQQRRVPQKRKIPLKKRIAIMIVRLAEEQEKKKQQNSRPGPKAQNRSKPASKKPGSKSVPGRKPQGRPPQGRPAPKGQPTARGPRTPAEQRRAKAAYMKKMRKRRRNLRIAAGTILFLLVVMILSRTVLFKISNIQVTNPGEANYTVDQIAAQSGIVYGTQNLFRCDVDKVAKNIEQRLPYIGKAVVERDFPSALTVTITPTKAAAAVAYGTGYLIIDSEGKMLESLPTAPENIPVLRCNTDFEANLGQYIGVSVNGKKADDATKAAADTIALFRSVYSAATEAGINDLTLIDIRDVRAITLMYQNRLTLHLGTDDKLDIKLKTAAKTIAAESDASKTRTGAIDLTTVPYAYARDTYDATIETDPDAENTTEVVENRAG